LSLLEKQSLGSIPLSCFTRKQKLHFNNSSDEESFIYVLTMSLLELSDVQVF
jgi:hypothetical protein